MYYSIQKMKEIISKDLFCTGINQLWRILTGPIIMLLIPLFLASEVQGYWYMFTSLAALVVFADLGFSNIILQFAAHEFAYLKFDSRGEIVGREENLKKLSSFFKFSIRWIGGAVLAVFPIIFIIGYYFLSLKSTDVEWKIPWIMYSVSSGLVFSYSSLLCFFEGCDSVGKVQMIRFKIVVFTSLTTILGLCMHWDLYALAGSLVVSAIVGVVLLWREFSFSIKEMWNISKKFSYPWRKSFLDLLWRYAISWCSGYLIFQLFTPLAFYYHDPTEAGKIGLSISLWTAGYGIANIWIVSIIPKINILVAKREWEKLDSIFRKNMWLAMITFFMGSVIAFGIYFVFQRDYAFFDRICGLPTMVMLCFSWLFQIIVNGIAIYLRAHKKEPLMPSSVFGAVYISLTTYLCAKYLDVQFLFLGYLSSYCIGLPWVICILYKQKKQHKEMVTK